MSWCAISLFITDKGKKKGSFKLNFHPVSVALANWDVIYAVDDKGWLHVLKYDEENNQIVPMMEASPGYLGIQHPITQVWVPEEGSFDFCVETKQENVGYDGYARNLYHFECKGDQFETWH